MRTVCRSAWERRLIRGQARQPAAGGISWISLWSGCRGFQILRILMRWKACRAPASATRTRRRSWRMPISSCCRAQRARCGTWSGSAGPGTPERSWKRSRAGALIIGICGGYQMLGNSVTDSTGAEAAAGESAAGLGLLPVDTVFSEEKTLGLTQGRLVAADDFYGSLSDSPVRVSGYEIHMGESEIDTSYSDRCRPLLRLDDGRTEGCVLDGVIGTYLHGIFDSREFTEALLRTAAERRGIRSKEFRMTDRKAYKEIQYDRLADILRESLDIGKIYGIMGLAPDGAADGGNLRK